MNKPVSSLIAIAGLAFALVGCDETAAPGTTRDVLAEDSTLNLAVMTAAGDSESSKSDTPVTSGVGDVAPSGVPVRTSTTSVAEASAPVAPIVTAAPKARKISEPAPRRSATRVSATRRVATSQRPSVQRTRRVAAHENPARERATRAVTSTRSTNVSRRTTSTRSSTTMRAQTTVPAGWELSFASDDRVCTNTSATGDKFTAHLASDIVGPMGVVIPKGAVATGVVSNVRRGGKRADLDVDVESVTYGGRTYPVSSDVTYTETKKVRSNSKTGDATRVAAGAGIGAVTGSVIGRNTKATVIGAAAGALGGAVLASQTRRYDECVPDGGKITTRLTEPLTIASTD